MIGKNQKVVFKLGTQVTRQTEGVPNAVVADAR